MSQQNTPWRDLVRLIWNYALMIVVTVIFVGVVLAVTGGLWLARYRECRAHGFSQFYCWTSK